MPVQFAKPARVNGNVRHANLLRYLERPRVHDMDPAATIFLLRLEVLEPVKQTETSWVSGRDSPRCGRARGKGERILGKCTYRRMKSIHRRSDLLDRNAPVFRQHLARIVSDRIGK